MSSKRDGGDAGGTRGDSTDLEEQPTELWAPVARRLFGKESAPDSLAEAGGQGPDTDPEVPHKEPEEHDTEVMPGYTADTVEMPPEEAARAIADARRGLDEKPSEPEEITEEEEEERPPETASGEYDAPDTLEVPAHEAAMAVAEAHEALSETVEVSGEEGQAARQLALEESQRRKYDPSATMVVDRPRNLPKLSHECRMCGRRVTRPAPRRLRGPLQGDQGFRCEKCNNVFCAAHVVRVSSLWESLFSGGRFRCQLCLPQVAHRGRRE